MLIRSQLIGAALEHRTSDYSSSSTGVIWYRTDTDVIKFCTGAAVKTVVDTDSAQALSNKTQYDAVRGTSGLASGQGILRLSDITTDATAKVSAASSRHYTNSEEDVCVYYANATNGANAVNIGGGVAALNAATVINFYTGANSTTTTGTSRGSISSTGVWTIGASGAGVAHAINGSVDVTYPTSGQTGVLGLTNSSNTADSSALIYCDVAGTSAGDAYYRAAISGGVQWTWGLDNSDSDAWVLSQNNGLGTNNFIKVATAGGVTLGASGGSQEHTINGSTAMTLQMRLTEISTPSTPASGTRMLYAKSDGIYHKDSGGTETKLTGISNHKMRYDLSGSSLNIAIANGATEIIDFDTAVFETTDVVTTGASWAYTAPYTGIYRIDSRATLAALAGGVVVSLDLYKGGVFNTNLCQQVSTGDGDGRVCVGGSCLVSLSATNTVDIRITNNDASSRNLTTSAGFGYVCIEYMGTV